MCCRFGKLEDDVNSTGRDSGDGSLLTSVRDEPEQPGSGLDADGCAVDAHSGPGQHRPPPPSLHSDPPHEFPPHKHNYVLHIQDFQTGQAEDLRHDLLHQRRHLEHLH